MHTFFKIILVLIITGIGAFITCGGNLLLAGLFGPKTMDFPILHPFFIVLWGIEIIASLIYGIKIMKSWETFSGALKKRYEIVFFIMLFIISLWLLMVIR